MRRLLFSFVLLMSIVGTLWAQDDEKERKWQLKGYLKDLVTVGFVGDSVLVDNLIHNRLNFKWYPVSSLNIYMELRTRAFHGDLVRTIPDYAELIDNNDDLLDLSAILIDNDGFILHTMLDRAYAEWIRNNWEIRIGRQRINWGTNLIWNPNDVFNAYSFFDFDYEERPGSDAIRIKKYTGFASSVEVAASFTKDFENSVVAGMWTFNRNNYDVKILTGKSYSDIILGTGWAGNIGKGGFKGEITWFKPYDKDVSYEALLASVSLDYSFKNSLYLLGSVLYNSAGESEPPSDLFLIRSRTLTAKELSPYSWSTFLQGSYQVHPLVLTGLAVILYPTNGDLFVNPSVTVSLVKNLDLDLIGQLFFGEIENYALYGRLKWSF